MIRVAVITVSDSVVAGARQDSSGAVVAGWVKAKKFELVNTTSCADETLEIVRSLLRACDTVVSIGERSSGPERGLSSPQQLQSVTGPLLAYY